jgi:hypothetical protein
VQGNPRKTKEKSLDFLGLLWSNRDFSTGYDESKQKNRRTLKLASRIVLLLKSLDVPYFACVSGRGPRYIPT